MPSLPAQSDSGAGLSSCQSILWPRLRPMQGRRPFDALNEGTYHTL